MSAAARSRRSYTTTATRHRRCGCVPGTTSHVKLINNSDGDTNLHTHGFHVSPVGSGDNVLHHLMPGGTWDLAIDTPDDLSSGFYWYHTHNHGDAESQVTGGLAGAIVVEGPLDAVAGASPADPSTCWMIQASQFDEDGQIVPVADQTTNSVTRFVNGQLNPVIRMRPGEVQRWRIANIQANDFMELSLDGHRLHQIAADANPFDEVVAQDSIVMAPANRVEVLVEAGQPGTYVLRARSFAGSAAAVLATLEVAGEPVEAEPLPDRAAPVRRPPRRCCRRDTGTFTFSNHNKTGWAVIDGKAFDADRVDQTIQLGALEEWTIRNDSRRLAPVPHPRQRLPSRGNRRRAVRGTQDLLDTVPRTAGRRCHDLEVVDVDVERVPEVGVVATVHSSSAPSSMVWSTRSGSNGLPSMTAQPGPVVVGERDGAGSCPRSSWRRSRTAAAWWTRSAAPSRPPPSSVASTAAALPANDRPRRYVPGWPASTRTSTRLAGAITIESWATTSSNGLASAAIWCSWWSSSDSSMKSLAWMLAMRQRCTSPGRIRITGLSWPLTNRVTEVVVCWRPAPSGRLVELAGLDHHRRSGRPATPGAPVERALTTMAPARPPVTCDSVSPCLCAWYQYRPATGRRGVDGEVPLPIRLEVVEHVVAEPARGHVAPVVCRLVSPSELLTSRTRCHHRPASAASGPGSWPL